MPDAEASVAITGFDGWAATLDAVDITTQQPLGAPAEPVNELLDHLDIAGNNGWFDAPGKRESRRTLGDLDQLVDRHYAVARRPALHSGAMLAAGHSKELLEGLEKL